MEESENPRSIIVRALDGKENVEDPVVEYMFSLINRLRIWYQSARDTMENEGEKRKLWYDQKTIKREFHEGEEVLVLATARPNKLSVSWIGPGTIEKRLSETNYVVRMPGRTERSVIYHINMLKPYYRRQARVCALMHEIEESSKDLEIEIPTWDADPRYMISSN